MFFALTEAMRPPRDHVGPLGGTRVNTNAGLTGASGRETSSSPNPSHRCLLARS